MTETQPREWLINAATTEGDTLEIGVTFGAVLDTPCLVFYLDHVSDSGWLIPLEPLERAIAEWREHGHA